MHAMGVAFSQMDIQSILTAWGVPAIALFPAFYSTTNEMRQTSQGIFSKNIIIYHNVSI